MIRAEILKISKLKIVRLASILSLVFLIIFFYQKAININSGYYERDLIYPMYISSFFLLSLDLVGGLYFIIIGSSLVNIEYQSSTWGVMLNKQSKSKVIISKVTTLMLICLCSVITVAILGFLLGGIYGRFFYNLDILLLVKQILTITIFSFIYGGLGIILTMIMKNSAIAIILSFFIINFQSFIAQIIPFIKDVILTKYQIGLIGNVFINIINDQQLIVAMNDTPIITSVIGIICYTTIFIIIISVLIKKFQLE